MLLSRISFGARTRTTVQHPGTYNRNFLRSKCARLEDSGTHLRLATRPRGQARGRVGSGCLFLFWIGYRDLSCGPADN
ncbi:hypothetical protein HPP92_001440 [Vanilla planifolia]|uniref:Uncharacterized protein n=1 Tax=Vanilla planifolia TaxID=51239 RepID=A0A835VLJ5_VANPL|nr:hypothetical protein HPP92_001440 [Vanilla planifolia]